MVMGNEWVSNLTKELSKNLAVSMQFINKNEIDKSTVHQ